MSDKHFGMLSSFKCKGGGSKKSGKEDEACKTDKDKKNAVEDDACKTDKDKSEKNAEPCAPDDEDEEESASFEPELNEDGTLAVDIFRTGNWYHPWYGPVSVNEADLQNMIKNFDEGIVGNVITFNYYHERNKNFGTPKKLRIEERMGKFSPKPFKMLVADTMLTEQGLNDVRRGEVLNFSSEIDHNYIHREIMEVPLVDDATGQPVLDENGKQRMTFLRKKYGATLLGGAVTNYPFITELNPNGLGGNRGMFEDEQGYSNPVIGSPDSLYKNDKHDSITAMLFHNVDLKDIDKSESNKAKAELENSIVLSASELEEIQKICTDPVLFGDCIYSKDEYKAGDAALPDVAYAVIYEVKGASGKMLKVRKLPHHTSGVKSPDDNTSLDVPRLKNALARVNQTDAPAAKITAATAHLNKHADATYRKKDEKKSDNTSNNSTTEVGMDDTRAPNSFDAASPEVMAFAEKLTTELTTKFTAQLNEMNARNMDLSTRLAEFQKTAVEAETRAFEAEVTSFADKVCGGKLPPAAKEVIRCGLRGNVKYNMKYFASKTDGTFEYQDMSIRDYTEKLLAALDPVMQNLGERVSVTAPAPNKQVETTTKTNVETDKSLPQNFAASLLENEEAYVDMMTGAGCGPKDKVRSRTAIKFVNRTEAK